VFRKLNALAQFSVPLLTSRRKSLHLTDERFTKVHLGPHWAGH
jgi:hypothetical protein